MKKLDRKSSENLAQLCLDNREKVFVCIGNPKNLWDSFGPMVGSMLQLHNIYVYGSIICPLTSENIDEVGKKVKEKHPNAVIIAIDAASSSLQKHIGKIIVKDEGIQPGGAFSKDLNMIGDYSILFAIELGDIDNKFIEKPFIAALDTYNLIKTSLSLR